MGKPPTVAGSVGSEVPTCLREAQTTVRTTATLIGIMVVLAVVFPEAHGADLEVPPLLKSQVTAARTRVRLTAGKSAHIDEHTRDCCLLWCHPTTGCRRTMTRSYGGEDDAGGEELALTVKSPHRIPDEGFDLGGPRWT